MKLSRTGWNNVIIFSVMIIIILINATNNRLFPDDDSSNNTNSEQSLLAEHAVVLTLEINKEVLFERVGKNWQVTAVKANNSNLPQLNQRQIEQMIFSWQQTGGLVQADDVVITGQQGINVFIETANSDQRQTFTLYPLIDQLLVRKQLSKDHAVWLALPQALTAQLLPCCLSAQ